MSRPSQELVLCSAVAELPPAWLPQADAIALSESALHQHLASIPPRWLPRSQAEQDPTYKQWIPYLLLLNSKNQIAAYTRQGNETRLQGHWSLGLGGHINPCDAAPAAQNFSWPQTFRRGLQRELREEYPTAAPGRTTFLGIVHESLTPVGHVHLGVVYLHQIQHPPGTPGPELHQLQWLTLETIGRHPDWPRQKFELWSQLALKLLPLLIP